MNSPTSASSSTTSTRGRSHRRLTPLSDDRSGPGTRARSGSTPRAGRGWRSGSPGTAPPASSRGPSCASPSSAPATGRGRRRSAAPGSAERGSSIGDVVHGEQRPQGVRVADRREPAVLLVELILGGGVEGQPRRRRSGSWPSRTRPWRPCPASSVISIDRARITRFSTESGSPAADEELVTSSERTRAGKRSAKRVAIPAPSEARRRAPRRIPRWSRTSLRSSAQRAKEYLAGSSGLSDRAWPRGSHSTSRWCGGEGVAVGVPHVGVAADPVGEHERGAPAAVLLVVEPHPVVGPDEWHGGILAARGSWPKVSHLTRIRAIQYF